MKFPERYTAAKRALAEATRVDEVKDIRDKAIAMEVYARQAKDGELIGYATEIRKRAERRLGEMMAISPKAKGKQSAKGFSKNPLGAPALKDQGVDKNLADRARKAAAKSSEKFEADVAKAKANAIASVEGSKEVIKAARKERQEEKNAKRAQREKELAEKQKALPNKRYGVIVADPEWQFEPWSRTTGMDRAAANHYPTSVLDAIKARDVPSISAKDCVLFLWATNPMLPHALLVMAAWGFDYKSNHVWGKDKAGTGYWNREKHELLLIGTRGHIPCPSPGKQWESLIMAPRGKHSEKPECFLEMIESYFPNLPKIELNRRGAPRKGWDAWGNETRKKIAA
jgi:N6-adenosine-specific RNA methylase IME4